MAFSFDVSSPPVTVKWTASHMLNNLTVNRASQSSRSTTLGVSHKSGFAMATASEDGAKQFQAQIICRAIGDNNTPVSDNDARFIPHVVQAAFIHSPTRDLLVLSCTKSVQIYEPDGATNLHIHMLAKNSLNRTEFSMYSRGIASIGSNFLGVGNHQGEILVFTIPKKGTNFVLKDTLAGHQYGITGLVSDDSSLISSDTSGRIVIWNVSNLQQRHDIEPMDHSGVTSLALWQNYLIAGYANGMIRIFDTKHAQISGSIAAHARCINALDCNDDGLVASVSDDCFVRMWSLSDDAENLRISHEGNHHMEQRPLVGVKFLNPSRADIAVSAFESNEIIILRA